MNKIIFIRSLALAAARRVPKARKKSYESSPSNPRCGVVPVFTSLGQPGPISLEASQIPLDFQLHHGMHFLPLS